MVRVDNIKSAGNVVPDPGILLPDGSASDPSLAFVSDPSSGLFYSGGANNRVMVTSNGTTVMQFDQTGVYASKPVYVADGTEANPGLSFTNARDVGFYVPQAHTVSIVGEGTTIATFYGASPSLGFTDPGIVSLYDFDTDIKDDVSGYDLTDTGGTLLVTNVLGDAGKTIDNAASFAGTSALYSTAAGLMNFTNNTAMTLAFVFRSTDTTLNRGILQFHFGGSTHRLRIAQESGAIRVLLDKGSNYLGFFTPAISINVWYHIVLVIDNADIQPVRLYLNTVEPLLTYDIGTSVTLYQDFTSSEFALGAFTSGLSGPVQGQVAYVTLSTTVWDSTIINAHYNSVFVIGATALAEFPQDVRMEQDCYMISGAAQGLIMHSNASGLMQWDAIAYPFSTNTGVLSLNIVTPSGLLCTGTYNAVEAHGIISLDFINVDNFAATIDIDMNALTGRNIASCHGTVSFSTNGAVNYTGYIVQQVDNMRVIFNNGFVVPGGANAATLKGVFHIIFV